MLLSPFLQVLEQENTPRSLQCLSLRLYSDAPLYERVTHLVDQLFHCFSGADGLANIKEGLLDKQFFRVPDVRLGHHVLVIRASALSPSNTFNDVFGRSYIHVEPVWNLAILQRMVTKPVIIVRQIVAPLSHT